MNKNFYIFLNKTIDICEFESWLKLRPWLNSMTQTQIMTQQKYTLTKYIMTHENSVSKLIRHEYLLIVITNKVNCQ